MDQHQIFVWTPVAFTAGRNRLVLGFGELKPAGLADPRPIFFTTPPDRFSSLPIVASVGLPSILLDRPGLSHESSPLGLGSSMAVNKIPPRGDLTLARPIGLGASPLSLWTAWGHRASPPP